MLIVASTILASFATILLGRELGAHLRFDPPVEPALLTDSATEKLLESDSVEKRKEQK